MLDQCHRLGDWVGSISRTLQVRIVISKRLSMGDTGLTWLTIVLTFNSSSSYHRSYPSCRCRLHDDDWADHVVALVMKVLSITALSVCLGHYSDRRGVPLNGSNLLREDATSTCVPIRVMHAPQIWVNLTWYCIFKIQQRLQYALSMRYYNSPDKVSIWEDREKLIGRLLIFFPLLHQWFSF